MMKHEDLGEMHFIRQAVVRCRWMGVTSARLSVSVREGTSACERVGGRAVWRRRPWREAAFRRQTRPTYGRSGSLTACDRGNLLLVETPPVFYESCYLWGEKAL